KRLIALERHAQIQRCLVAGWTPGALEKLAEEMGTSSKTAMRTMDQFFLGGEQLVFLIPGIGRFGRD
ncbi:MAG: hypothetical protein M0Z31_02860, partial [Clostridia bacterium]|nr:hypothetical protein [Clostridia bacterium]